MEGKPEQRPLVPLLGIIAGLLFLLVLGSAVTGVIFIRTANHAKEALVQELPARQEDTSRRLSAAAQRINVQVDEFERRRQDLEGTPAGPLDKLDRMIRLQQLLADEQLALLRHLQETQLAVANAARPLPEQQQVLAQGRTPEKRDRTQARTARRARDGKRGTDAETTQATGDATLNAPHAPERPPPTAPEDTSK